MANTRDVMGEQECLDALVADELDSFEDDGITKVGDYALYHHMSLTDVTLPNATSIGSHGFSNCESLEEIDAQSVANFDLEAFSYCRSLERVSLGNIASVSSSSFSWCESLREVAIGRPTSVGSRAFANCKSLTPDSLNLSNVKTVDASAFSNSGLGMVELPECTSIGSYAFEGTRTSVVDLGKSVTLNGSQLRGAYSLCHLILRGATSVPALASGAIAETPLARGLGWIYVPEGMVDSFKSTSPWSPYASQIASISEYPKAMQDETVSDPWQTIAASTSYATDYPLGSVKYLDVGGTQLAMELVATDCDDLATGGKARMTWLSRDIFDTFKMGKTQRARGGWAESLLRDWLRTVIYPQIDPTVKSAIKSVTKTYVDDSGHTLSIADTLWIPSFREVINPANSSAETSGCDYISRFSGSADRIKSLGIVGQANIWWLRTASDYANFSGVSTTGASLTTSPYPSSYGVVIGFCI